MKLIGIGGTDGSGKDTVGALFAKQKGWLFVSVTDMLRQEAKRRGLPLERRILRQISSEWRQQRGLGVLIDKALAEFEKESKKRELDGLAVVSLRNFGEADRVHELGGQVVWVDADPKIRYQRVTNRNRGSEDHVTFEQFMAEEAAQMHHSGDETTLNLAGVKERADIFIINDGNDIKVFKAEAIKALGLK